MASLYGGAPVYRVGSRQVPSKSGGRRPSCSDSQPEKDYTYGERQPHDSKVMEEARATSNSTAYCSGVRSTQDTGGCFPSVGQQQQRLQACIFCWHVLQMLVAAFWCWLAGCLAALLCT